MVPEKGLLNGCRDKGVEVEILGYWVYWGTGATGTALVAGRWTERMGVHHEAKGSRHRGKGSTRWWKRMRQ